MARLKIKEKEQARALRAKGKSLNEIVSVLGVSKSSVSLWVRDVRLSRKQQNLLKQREISGAVSGRKVILEGWRKYRKLHPQPERQNRPERSVESFFDTWSPEMAYVLGFFAADGCMYQNNRGSKYIAFYSVEEEMIQMIKTLLNVTNRIEIYDPPNRNHQRKFTLQIGSRDIYNRLLELGLTPNKSLTLRLPEIPDEVLCHFVRGNLDGDGSVYAGIVKRLNRPNNTKLLLTRFTCGSYDFLYSLKQRIREATDITSGSLTSRSEQHHVLGYSTGASRQLYEFMYPMPTVPCLKRKRRTFENGLKLLVP